MILYHCFKLYRLSFYLEKVMLKLSILPLGFSCTLFFSTLSFAVGLTEPDQEVTIEISGWIKRTCGLKNLPTKIDLGNLETKKNQRIEFTVNCNAPFSYGISSNEGGLKYVNESKASNLKTTTMIPYHLDVTIPMDRGIIKNSCASKTLPKAIGEPAQCKFSDSGQDVSIDKTATMDISWNLKQT